MMKAILKLFSIKKDERWAALLLTCYLLMLNVLAIQQHFEEFTCSEHVGFYSLFFQYFHLSGFDPFTYVILSEWRSLYVLSRHPLLAVFIYPLYGELRFSGAWSLFCPIFETYLARDCGL